MQKGLQHPRKAHPSHLPSATRESQEPLVALILSLLLSAPSLQTQRRRVVEVRDNTHREKAIRACFWVGLASSTQPNQTHIEKSTRNCASAQRSQLWDLLPEVVDCNLGPASVLEHQLHDFAVECISSGAWGTTACRLHLAIPLGAALCATTSHCSRNSLLAGVLAVTLHNRVCNVPQGRARKKHSEDNTLDIW